MTALDEMRWHCQGSLAMFHMITQKALHWNTYKQLWFVLAPDSMQLMCLLIISTLCDTGDNLKFLSNCYCSCDSPVSYILDCSLHKDSNSACSSKWQFCLAHSTSGL